MRGCSRLARPALAAYFGRVRRLQTFLPMMAAALAASSSPVSAWAGPPKPTHIMSMNMCTDMLLLDLVPKSRIASVTYLAHEAVQSTHPGIDRGVAINHGTAEDIVAEKPDLIFADDFSAPVARRLAKRVLAHLVEVKAVSSFADIRAVTRQMATTVGEETRGEAMIADMDRKLAWLAAHSPARRYTVAAWSGGSVPGRGTLANEIIEAAGAVNIASKLDSASYNTFGVEELLRADPDVLIYGGEVAAKPGLYSLALENSAVRARWTGRTVSYPDALFSCGVPQSADAAILLRQALDKVPPRPRRW